MNFEISFTVPLLFSEEEVEITCEFNVTSWGSGDTYWSPGNPPEWEVEKIFLDGDEVPISEKTEIQVDIMTPGHFEGHQWIPHQPYGRFRESKIISPLWESLAEACDTYIGENFEFVPDYDDPY